jgi:gluconolactonase
MITSLLLLFLYWLPIEGADDELLKIFREEFVSLAPGQNDTHSENFHYQGKIATSMHPFAIARYEVPQNLWNAVIGDNPSRWKGDRNSVEMLSFDEAVVFCRRLTTRLRKAGLIREDQFVRLPTEIEWEYAARAGSETLYSFGDQADLLDQYAWSTQNAAGNDPAVGELKPNAWDLYDMHGYLWEWTIDCDEYQKSAFINEADWEKLTAENRPRKQVLRGGSWKDSAEKLACAFRRTAAIATRDDAIGLRCVLVSTQLKEAEVKSASFHPTAQDDFVDADEKLKLLWCDGEFTEGPAAAKDGSIIFSDIGDRILRFNPVDSTVQVIREPSGRSNGLMFDARGNLVACEGANGGNRRLTVSSFSLEPNRVVLGEAQLVTDALDGKKFNSPNDLTIDQQGRIYFTDPRYVGDEPRELDFEGILMVDVDGTTKVANRDVTKPNGIVVSADGRSMYVAEHHPTGDKQLLKFAVNQDGTLTDKRVLFDFGKGRGIDGMTMDQAGNLYATAGDGAQAGIYIFGAEGEQLALIPLPGSPTNVVFGKGQWRQTLFITAARPSELAAFRQTGSDLTQGKSDGEYGLYCIKVKQPGYHLPTPGAEK